MEFYQWLSLLVAVVGGFLGLWVTSLRVALGLEGRFRSMENELRKIDSTLEAHSALLSIVSGSIQRLGGWTDQDIKEIVKQRSKNWTSGAEAAIGKAMGLGSPISHEEADRLRVYVQMARQGQPFTPEQVEDFYDLSGKLSKEVPNEPGVWPLLALAGFLFGLYMGARK